MPEAKTFWNSFSKAALDLLYPPKCGLCGFLGDNAICDACGDSFEKLDNQIVEQDPSFVVNGWARLYVYSGRSGQAVQRLKYSRVTSLAEPMSKRLWEFAERVNLDDADMYLPVPIHWGRRFLRGFNQAELLCDAFPRKSVRKDVLLRWRATRPQVGLTPEERRKNLEGAFRTTKDLSGQKVVLVDDVLTTGVTIAECAKSLREAGAMEIYALAFAGA